jgi:hypothetical protein
MEGILHHNDAILLDACKLVRKNSVAMFEAHAAPIPHAFSARRVDGIENRLHRQIAGDLKQQLVVSPSSMHSVLAVSRQLFWIFRRKKVQHFLLFSKRKRAIIPVGNLKVEFW